MSGQILVGAGREIHAVPDGDFLAALKHVPGRMASRLAFMEREHHIFRDSVVREMPRHGKPLLPSYIAQATGLPRPTGVPVLDRITLAGGRIASSAFQAIAASRPEHRKSCRGRDDSKSRPGRA